MNKKIFALLFVLIFALSVSAVSAEDSGNFTALNTTITSATDTVDLSTDYVRGDADSANAIDINKNITINGNGKTIDGNNKGPIFTIGSGITVTVNNVTFIQGKGDYGGAIYNLGTLILNNCKFLNNTATYQGGAVYSTGDLTIDKCVFDNNNITTRNVNQGYGGAAIANVGGDLKVTNTDITNNIPDYVTRNSSAQYIGDLIRGAISSEGSASFENCNFINNSGCYGGAMTILDNNGNPSILEINNCIFKNNVAYNGGAIDILNGIANIKNSEFRNNSVIGKGDTNANSVGGAICAHTNSDVDITNCSFVDNSAAYSGGAIFIRDGDDTIRDCVFENNSAKLYGGAIYTEADLDVVGSNFTDNSAGTYGGAIYTYSDPGDQLNITDSKFTGNSAQYGGVLFNVEYANITNSEFTDNVATGSGGAIYGYAALDIAGSKFINNSALQGGAIINTKTTTVADSEFIDNVATTSSGGAIYNRNTLDVTDTKFENNSAKTYGGAIYNYANLDIKGSEFGNNTAQNGGAIFNYDTLEIDDTEFEGNDASVSGGAIFTQKTATVSNSKFVNNSAYNKGGAIYDKGILTVDNCVLDSNKVTTTTVDPVTWEGAQGSAIFCNNGSTLVISDSEIVNNYNIVDAKSYGAVTVGGTDATITGTKFVNNTGGFGGAVSAVRHRISGTDPINPSTLYVEDCIFENNTAYAGAAIAATASNYTVVNSTFANNNASSRYGGAIYAGRDGYENTSYGKITGSTFTDNTAIIGGAIAFANVDATVIDDCTFEGNTATNMGGAIGSPDTKTENVAVTNSLFKDNEAKYGGAIYTAAPLDVDASKFENNSASAYGGAIYTGKHADVSNSEFVDNTAPIGSAIFSYPDAAVLELDNVTSNKKNSFYDNGTYIDDNVTYITETTLNNISTSVLDNVTVAGNVTPKASGNVTVTIGDVVKTTPVVNGTFEVDMGKFAAGNYTITVKFDKNGQYLASEGTASLTVAKGTTTVEITEVPDLAVGESGDITADVKDANGNVIDTITVPFDATVAGEFNVPVIFDGNDNYEASSAVATVKVVDLTYTLESSDVVKYFKNGTQYTVKVTDSRGNPATNKSVTVYLDGKYFKGLNYTIITDENGVATLPINLGVGNYNITATFGDQEVKNTITVLPMTYTLSAEDIDMTFKDGTEYAVTVVDADGNPVVGKNVTLTINSPNWKKSATYNRLTDEKGVATLPINLAVGTYTITATYGAESVTTNVNVLKAGYKIETADVIKYFKNGTQYTVTVKDLKGNAVAGKNVSVTLSASSWKKPVTYNIVTDENGVATLTINLGPGSYSVSANVDGNIAKNSINVLPILTTESISKPVNQPASLFAKLVDGQGNPVAGKTVTFTVKTKSYDRLTDENGVASLPINLGIGKWNIQITDPATGAKTTATVTVTKAIS